MNIETKGQAIELLNKSIPYPEQIKNIDLEHKNVIYFDWRSSKYRLEMMYCSVYESDGCILKGSNKAILIEALLKSNLLDVV